MMETAVAALVFALYVVGMLVLLGIAWRLFLLLVAGAACGIAYLWEKTYA